MDLSHNADKMWKVKKVTFWGDKALVSCCVLPKERQANRWLTCLTASSSLSRRCCLLASLCWVPAEVKQKENDPISVWWWIYINDCNTGSISQSLHVPALIMHVREERKEMSCWRKTWVIAVSMKSVSLLAWGFFLLLQHETASPVPHLSQKMGTERGNANSLYKNFQCVCIQHWVFFALILNYFPYFIAVLLLKSFISSNFNFQSDCDIYLQTGIFTFLLHSLFSAFL